MRILHTSDWHLGHTLRSIDRDEEHARFLSWLLDALVRERVDALLVAGDVFDTANPPAYATRAYYGFLAEARRRLPGLDVVVVAGNHDSAARMDAPHPVLRELGVHVVGAMPRTDDGFDAERLVLPLTNAQGQVEAWVAAVPFLRQADLPHVAGMDPLIDGVRAVYDEALRLVRERMEPGQALLATGHCYMVGTTLSEQSERRILGGNQHPLPDSIFPPDVAYAALGHLHRAQIVGGRDNVRYSGSPIPLSMAEVDYEHQVVLLELSGGVLLKSTPLFVPRWCPMLRVPADGPGPVAEVLAALRDMTPCDPERPGYLDVRVQLDGPYPGLRGEVESAIAFKNVRLVSLQATYAGVGKALADEVEIEQLEELDPTEVFARRWAQKHEGEPPEDLVETFRELLEDVRGERATGQVELFPTFVPGAGT
ncbi:MAG: exonuclease subunit SbcD [Deltaproteobacteria bacterium]|nr:MAG: exonuclease subunit SbcD [Deltaproteobacteria bacterium]